MRLIDVDKSFKQLAQMYEEADGSKKRALRFILDTILTTPIIDPDSLRPKGRWIGHNRGENNWVECSECSTVGSPFWKCCPVCEAKMEVKE